LLKKEQQNKTVYKPERTSKGVTMLTSATDQKSKTIQHQPVAKALCIICSGNHFIPFCDEFIAMSPVTRLLKVKEGGLCFNCFRRGHLAVDCPKESYCQKEGCRLKHSKFLHADSNGKTCEVTSNNARVPSNQKGSSQERKTKDSHAASCNSHVKCGDEGASGTYFTSHHTLAVAMQVIPVVVEGKGKTSRMVYALLDPCSNVSLCTNSLLSGLKTEGKSTAIKINTVSGPFDGSVKEVCLTVHGVDTGTSLCLKKVFAVPSLPFPQDSIPKDLQGWSHLKDLKLPSFEAEEISLLIGADNPAAFKVLDVRKGSNEDDPYAIRYPLGWAIIGPLSKDKEQDGGFHFSTHFTHASNTASDLAILWDTEFNDMATTKSAMSVEDEKALNIMQQTAHVDDDGHWCIRLPWRNDPPNLIDNRKLAESRFKSLEKKLESSDTLKEQYVAKMNDYISQGFAIEAKDDPETKVPKWFLPHHAVFHPQKKKIRVVFHCSVQWKGSSLNGELLQGPDLMGNLLGVLLRFRQAPVAIASDIEGMFHQVRVPPMDRNARRFLWYQDCDPTKPVIEYQMKVHLFGATSSPSVCCFALKATADSQKENASALSYATIKENFYMDDLLKSISTSEEAISLAHELTQLLSNRGFHLTKWISNCHKVLETISPGERAENVKILNGKDLPTERALGVSWDVNSDSFGFCINIKTKSDTCTKRSMLSEIASLYDPCGFTAPVLLQAKHLLQVLHIRGIGWDDPVPTDVTSKWEDWKSALECLQDAGVPRCFIPEGFGLACQYQVHVFSDASEIGYAIVAYLRVSHPDNGVHVSFILGKSRLAPIKTVTIPRLELAAASLAASVSTFLTEELQIVISRVFFWTDSTTVFNCFTVSPQHHQTIQSFCCKSFHSYQAAFFGGSMEVCAFKAESSGHRFPRNHGIGSGKPTYLAEWTVISAKGE
jgi:hypothetical protein